MAGALGMGPGLGSRLMWGYPQALASGATDLGREYGRGIRHGQ